MRKVKMNVQGRVQGVGFRYMTKMVADQLGVTAEEAKIYLLKRSKKISAPPFFCKKLLHNTSGLRLSKFP